MAEGVCRGELEYLRKTLADLRDFKVEDALKEFAREFCEKEGVKPPNEIFAVPRDIVFVVTDGETDVASYRPCGEYMYVNKDEPYLFILLHELAHHVEYKKREEEHLKEILECREKGLRGRECPPERRAMELAKERFVEAIDLWEKKVEPVVGKGKIIPRWAFRR